MKITLKIPLVTSLITAAFFTTFSMIQHKMNHDELYEMWHVHVTEVSQGLSEYIGEWLGNKLLLIDMMTDRIDQNYTELEIQKTMDAPLLKKEFVLIFGALEKDGKPISNTPSWNPGETWDGRLRGWYQQARTAKQAILTPPYNDSATGRLLVSAVSKITDQGKFKGALGGDIELSMITDALSHINFSNKGRAFLLDDNGLIISHPNNTFNGKTTNTVYHIATPDVSTEFIETSGERTQLLTFTPVTIRGKSSNLMIGVALDSQEILGKLQRSRNITFVIIVLGSLITSFFLYFIIKFLLITPLTKLTNAVEELSLGKSNIEIEATERKDEIGVLAQAIHRMRVSLDFVLKKLKQDS